MCRRRCRRGETGECCSGLAIERVVVVIIIIIIVVMGLVSTQNTLCIPNAAIHRCDGCVGVPHTCCCCCACGGEGGEVVVVVIGVEVVHLLLLLGGVVVTLVGGICRDPTMLWGEITLGVWILLLINLV